MQTKHTYKITVAPVDNVGNTPKPLSFEVSNHDDILAIVDRLKTRPDIAEGSAAPLGLGLKLFGQVLIEQKDNPLFAPLLPHFREFMLRLKKG